MSQEITPSEDAPVNLIASEGSGDMNPAPKIPTADYLLRNGWRIIGTQKKAVGRIVYWDHDIHRPSLRGAFTTTAALEHQRELDRNETCDCIYVKYGRS